MDAPRTVTCEALWPQINELVDGTLADDARAEVERHLAACAHCRRVSADLTQIRHLARALPPRQPRADAWTRIEAALQAERPAAQGVRLGRWSPHVVTLAAAAVLVLAVASTVWLVRRPAAPAAPAAAASAPAAPTVHPAPEDLVKTVDEELQAAEQHYDRAIAGLEQITKSEQAVLDPGVAATLQKNLGVIDTAIKDSRAAIQAQPSNQLAQDSLFEALRRKVGLLEDTVALINAMRKGDQAGTAKVIDGMSKT